MRVRACGGCGYFGTALAECDSKAREIESNAYRHSSTALAPSNRFILEGSMVEDLGGH